MGISQPYHIDYQGDDPKLTKLFRDIDDMFGQLYQNVNRLMTTTTTTTAAVSTVTTANVVQSRTATTYNVTNAYADVTNVTVNITPRFTTSKVRVTACLMTFFGNALSTVSFQIVRSGTVLQQSEGIYNNNVAGFGVPIVLDYLDSPGSASALTYKIQAKFKNGGAIINSPINGGDVMFSSITVEEVLQ